MQFAKDAMYGSIANATDVISALAQLMEASGFSAVNRQEQSCNFGAFTVNNLPVLLQVNYDRFNENLVIVYKFAVPPLKDLTTDCIKFVLTRQNTL